MNHILKCNSCGKYSLQETCTCGGKCYKPKPPKYSPEDKYGKYRRKYIADKEGKDEHLDDDNTQED